MVLREDALEASMRTSMRTSMKTRTLLIAGASGIVGRAALEHFAARPGWRVIGLSRRRPDTDGEHLTVDLADRQACEARLGALSGVTHLLYAALYEKPGLIPGWREQDQMQTNLAMLRNCVEPLLSANPSLRHVSLLRTAYGARASHEGAGRGRAACLTRISIVPGTGSRPLRDSGLVLHHAARSLSAAIGADGRSALASTRRCARPKRVQPGGAADRSMPSTRGPGPGFRVGRR
jgi:nucleoside-diphosphate-sugar epimerase